VKVKIECTDLAHHFDQNKTPAARQASKRPLNEVRRYRSQLETNS
jgi:hypothetical protein